MKVLRFGQKIKSKESTLVLGAFKFVHNGHVELIKKAKEFKKLVSVMIIENPEFFTKEKPVQSLDDRLQDIANLDVDNVIILKMDNTIAAKDGKEILKKLKESVNAKQTVCGEDFAMGKNRSLKAKDIENNTIVKTLKINDRKLSTTILREEIQLGNFRSIKNLTPFGYTTSVYVDTKKVIQNKEFLSKPPGIYAVWVNVNEIIYYGYTHVSIEGTEKLYVPHLKIKNKPFNARIYYVKGIRKIYKSSLDDITEEDVNKIIKYLSI